MPTIKATEAGQDLRLERLKSLRETRKDLDELQTLRIAPEWAKLVRLLRRWSAFATLEEKAANREHDAEEISSEIFSRRVTRCRQKVSDFDFVADVLDKTKVQLETVDSEIKKVEAQYKSAKNELE